MVIRGDTVGMFGGVKVLLSKRSSICSSESRHPLMSSLHIWRRGASTSAPLTVTGAPALLVVVMPEVSIVKSGLLELEYGKELLRSAMESLLVSHSKYR